MALADELLGLEKQQQPQPNSWIKDLIDQRFQTQNARVKRKPVGFNFQREPFDPSSYYKALGSFRDISRLATNVTRQEVANREEAERQRALEESQNALNGINPNLTYDDHDHGGSGGSWSNGKYKYKLGPVSSTTAKAADYFGNKYGIRNVGGWREHGSVPGSDHPKGRALDFMVSAKSDKKRGDSLANDLIKNHKAWNVKYVIWNKYIWSPSRGWRRYNGPSPHTDHVHASFNK